ncbi:hypothetical protein AN480_24710 [Mycobacterium intracellulare subsp. chimaera]|uniref:DUF3060 domain-containing protein n=1 Tax=Mycobacterium intracellulare TaxID=1767 RepID=UPI00090B63AA|nr:DUF3060 domain-containing protein [Mycobacterium intracellulare]AOS93953.2 hypothetical protein AN480_24710 [Mycobacterium intracellulare subsp. chimaera]
MAANDDPEERIRELERPLAESAWASEQGSSASARPRSPSRRGPQSRPWSYGGPVTGPPPSPSGNRVWWILGTVIVIGVIALAGGIAAFAAHQISGVKSFITSPPSVPTTPAPSASRRAAPSTSPAPPRGARLSVAGINESRTIACNDNIVSVSGVSNTVTITGHCASLSVSGVQNAVTIEAAEAITASGFNNKVTYHSGTPKISNSGDSNVVTQG